MFLVGGNPKSRKKNEFLTPLLSNGLFYTVENINKINLLNISFTKDTLKVILIFSILDFFLILMIKEQAKNYYLKNLMQMILNL